MANELGDGNGSGYPSTIDTDGTKETSGTSTSYDLVNDLADAIIAIQTELGTDPALNKATVKAILQTEHDNDGEHTFKIPHNFGQDNVAASQAAVALAIPGTSAVEEIEMPWAGSIVGISVLTNDSWTAGAFTVDATINGSVTGLQGVLNVTNPDHHSATQAKDIDAFSAGDRLGCKITTDGSWLPTTADIIVIVYVSFNN